MMSRLFGLRIADQLPALRRYARSLTRDDDLADDLVHEALLLACEKHRSFRPDASIRSWLLAIVHNRFVSGRRREASERRRIDAASELSIGHCRAGQEHSAQLLAVAQAFEQLPDEQRAVLHLVAVEGLTYAEAAEALGVPVGTIMSRLSRARAALREKERMPTSTRPAGTQLRLVGGSDGSSV